MKDVTKEITGSARLGSTVSTCATVSDLHEKKFWIKCI